VGGYEIFVGRRLWRFCRKATMKVL